MNRIKDLREDKDMKQAELAEKLGIAKTTLSGYERQMYEPPFDILKKLSKIFNVTIDYIIGNSNNPTGEDFTKGMTAEEVEKMKEYKELLIAKREVKEKNKIIENLKKNA